MTDDLAPTRITAQPHHLPTTGVVDAMRTIVADLVTRAAHARDQHLARMLLHTHPDRRHLVRHIIDPDHPPRTLITDDPWSITLEADPPVTACDWPPRPPADKGEIDATDTLVRFALDALTEETTP